MQTDRQTENYFRFAKCILDAECVEGTNHNVQQAMKLLLIP